ncbi:MAG: pantoate--beta-alanine ligase [Sarcina sp.]
MICINKIKDLRRLIKDWKKQGISVGFVPTMGYLHEGHESLIKRAAKENDITVVSIFVNPTQFGANEDLESYPRDFDRDSKICERAGASIIFNPEVSEMYPDDSVTSIRMEGLTKELCGKSRPVHFGGVCTVVSKLFNIVTPDKAYFGEKDAQQLAVIKRMVVDLNMDVEVVGCPIVREKDGLAKSSRNTYLSEGERLAATILNKALISGKDLMKSGERNTEVIKSYIRNIIEKEEYAKVDYIEIVDSLTIEKIDVVEKSVLVAIAVYIGETRLIDNFTFAV